MDSSSSTIDKEKGKGVTMDAMYDILVYKRKILEKVEMKQGLHFEEHSNSCGTDS